MSPTSEPRHRVKRVWTRLVTLGRSSWVPLAALSLVLMLAWLNFLLTSRWAAVPGALHGGRRPWYAAALLAATVLTLATRRRVGSAVRIGRAVSLAILFAGIGVLLTSLLSRLPPGTWQEIPFKDDWTPLFQQAVNGVALLRRGVVVGWNWWFLGGYPTSTDIAQNFATLAFVPMSLFGDRLGYHLLHVVLFLAVPVFVWWDVRQEDRETALVATGFACLFAAGYFGPLGSSGDTNSLVGVFCAGLALMSSRAARLGCRWGGPLLVVALTLAMYSHTAFFVYAVIYLALEAAYFRDKAAAIRLGMAAAVSAIAALPAHWESFRYPDFVSFNNTVYDPGAPINWSIVLSTIYYNIEILALPHRWFNDYRSLANVWLPVLLVVALRPGRSRTGFYAWAAVVTQALLRVNTSEAGALFDRIQHMLPMLTAPALAGFVICYSGTRRLAIALIALIGLYVQTSLAPIRHVPELRAFNPALIDRIAESDGNMVLVEISPHRDMDSHPTRRSPTTPFDVHFEGLLPSVAGQRFYSQMIDGWVWNVWRGQVVGAGTYYGRPIEETPIEEFVREMRHWGVGHLFVWTDASRAYLKRSGRFVERWHDDRWSHFVLPDADTRSVITSAGRGSLRNLDFLGSDIELSDVAAGAEVVVRANYYPAWRAFVGEREIALHATDGQLAFRAPSAGSYVVRLEYPRYRLLSLMAMVVLIGGVWTLGRWPRQGRLAFGLHDEHQATRDTTLMGTESRPRRASRDESVGGPEI
jgi:hypothetical protein